MAISNPKSMVDSKDINLREHDFDTAECEYCRYFNGGNCKVLAISVEEEQVCDAYQGDNKKYKPYTIDEKDIMSFVNGMVIAQPYQHKVIKGISTPVGPLIIIKDTMQPKPHIFSLDMKFSVEHTSREHAWTTKEVNALIKLGRVGNDGDGLLWVDNEEEE